MNEIPILSEKKRPTGKWRIEGVPHRGWEYVEKYDNFDVDGQDEFLTCHMCEFAQVRYVHVLRHDDYPDELHVGYICAAHMEDPYKTQERERGMKNESARRLRVVKRKERERRQAEERKKLEAARKLELEAREAARKLALEAKLEYERRELFQKWMNLESWDLSENDNYTKKWFGYRVTIFGRPRGWSFRVGEKWAPGSYHTIEKAFKAALWLFLKETGK